jgi:hypothetical protein
MKLNMLAALGAGALLTSCAPAAPPPPPQAAAACHCTVNSIMFFDPGQSALTPKTIAGLAQDAALHARQPPEPLTVTGGADAPETAVDPDISRQRAEAVAAQLITDGIPAAEITIRDNGTSAPPDFASQVAVRLNPHYAIVAFDAPTLHEAAPAPPPASAGPYQVQGVVLYEMPPVLVARLGPDSRPFRAYIAQLDAALAPVFAAAPPQPGLTAAIVIGLKPGGAVRSWLVDRPGAIPPALAGAIRSTVQAVPPPKVQAGPIAFAIRFTAWGGGAPITDAAHPVPYPTAWEPAPPDGIAHMPDVVFARIWP